MKLKLMLSLAVGAYVIINTSLLWAGIDQEKWKAFVKSELQGVSDEVAKSGKAPVARPLVADYDTNKDNFIDATEVKAINIYLGQN